jgi:hypothetical protein
MQPPIVIDSNLFDLQLKLILPDPDFVFQRYATIFMDYLDNIARISVVAN